MPAEPGRAEAAVPRQRADVDLLLWNRAFDGSVILVARTEDMYVYGHRSGWA